jgi:hypothetical protein
MIVASTANQFVRHLRNLFRISKLKVKRSSVMAKANWNIPPGQVVLPQENNLQINFDPGRTKDGVDNSSGMGSENIAWLRERLP